MATESPDPAVPGGPGAVGIAARVGVAILAFLSTGAVLRRVASPAGGPLVGAKREFLEVHANRFDTVFVGSSHVYRGFVPGEFDRLLGIEGLSAKSLNYGVQLPDLLESRFLIREILEKSPGLKRLFFEYQSLAPQIDPANAFQPRSVYWHDQGSTGLAVERAVYWGSELGDGLRYVEDSSAAHSIFGLCDRLIPDPLRISNLHIQHYLSDVLFVGRSKDVGRGLLGRRHGQTARFEADAGYISLEEENRRLSERGQPDNPYQRRIELFAESLANYRRTVERLKSESRVVGDEEWMNAEMTRVHDLELIARIAREVQDAGVEFVLVIMPQQSADRDLEEELAQVVGVPVLRYNLPERHPDLYAPEMRFDSGHLSEEGALRFTRTLAHDYLRLVRRGEG